MTPTPEPAKPVASGTSAPSPVATVVQYSVSCLPRDHVNYRHYVVSVIERERGRWVVRANGEIRDANGDPIEPCLPSANVAAWAAKHRFDLDTALALANRLASTLVLNDYTVAHFVLPVTEERAS